MAQELTLVSPIMHKEFVLPYQQKLCKRFGLLSYGCCEANDYKWDNLFETFDNLRELSVSHACNFDIAVDKIRDKYVFAWKPHCGMITNFDEKSIEEKLTEGCEKAKNCHLLICLRDNLTLYGEPERVTKWVDIAQDVAKKYA
jgi:hypothetical protein